MAINDPLAQLEARVASHPITREKFASGAAENLSGWLFRAAAASPAATTKRTESRWSAKAFSVPMARVLEIKSSGATHCAPFASR